MLVEHCTMYASVDQKFD